MPLTAEVSGNLSIQNADTGEVDLTIAISPFFKTVTKWNKRKRILTAGSTTTLEQADISTVSMVWVRLDRESTIKINGTTDSIASCKELVIFGTISSIQIIAPAGVDTNLEYVIAGT